MKTEWDAITKIKAENREFKKRIAELEDEAVDLKEEISSLHVYSFRVIASVTRAVEKLKGVPEFKPTGDVLNRVLRLTPKIALESHNLEQQAKALFDYACSTKPLTERGLNLESIALSDQAEALKEQA